MLGRIAISKIVWVAVPTVALGLIYVGLFWGMGEAVKLFQGYKIWIMTVLSLLPLFGYYLNLFEIWRVDIECINYDQGMFWLALCRTFSITLLLSGITYFGGLVLSYLP